MQKLSKKSLLFLCIGNSCRSQMAEGFARHYYGNQFDIQSAGLRESKLDPLALEVMKEISIDISNQFSKSTDYFKDRDFDFVITVCEEGAKECPYFKANIANLHKPFRDPPKITKDLVYDDKLSIYREVRDEIREFVSKELIRLVA